MRNEQEVPIGLEKVLYMAAVEPAFREELLRDREEAVRRRGLSLQDSEVAMLRLAPADQLAAAIDALDTSQTNLERRRFIGSVAGAVTLAAGSVLAGCEEPIKTMGIRPSDGAIAHDLRKPGLDVGAGVRVDDLGIDKSLAPAGIRPDDAGSEGRKPDAK